MLRTHLVTAKTVNTVLIVNLCLSILQGYSVLGAALGALSAANTVLFPNLGIGRGNFLSQGTEKNWKPVDKITGF